MTGRRCKPVNCRGALVVQSETQNIDTAISQKNLDTYLVESARIADHLVEKEAHDATMLAARKHRAVRVGLVLNAQVAKTWLYLVAGYCPPPLSSAAARGGLGGCMPRGAIPTPP